MALFHAVRNGWALKRRRGVTPRVQAQLAELEAEAERRGIVVRGWRPYPAEDGVLATVQITRIGLVEKLPRGRGRESVVNEDELRRWIEEDEKS